MKPEFPAQKRTITTQNEHPNLACLARVSVKISLSNPQSLTIYKKDQYCTLNEK